MQQNSVIAVVVTYNRLNLLIDLINSLRNQTYPISKIIVVNNGSTDETADWLEKQNDLTIFHQDNCGSSGGQYRSIKEAMTFDYEWVWVMDDDIIHDKNTLENLMKFADSEKVLTTLRYTNQNEVFYNDTLSYNLSSPFKSFWGKVINKDILDQNKDLIKADGITFEGPLIHRNIIKKVGLPLYNLFIYGDDTEFLIRVTKANYPIYIVKNAKTTRRLDYTLDQKDNNGKLIFNWKHYYIIRNIIVINRLHGNIFVRHLRPIIYLILWYLRASNSDDRAVVFKAFKDALKYKDNPPI